MYVKPAQGLSIRDPDLLDLLPESGRLVPDSDYWLRRVRDEDVVLADPPSEATESAVPAANAEEHEQ